MTDSYDDIWSALHNRSALLFRKGKADINNELNDLKEILSSGKLLLDMTEEEAIELISKADRLLSENNIKWETTGGAPW